MSKKALPKVKSIGELRRLATTEGPLMERYKSLAVIAAENLGMVGAQTLERAIRHLNMNADETDENGVMGEVNFVRDIEASRAG
jgi:hypothetical protein